MIDIRHLFFTILSLIMSPLAAQGRPGTLATISGTHSGSRGPLFHFLVKKTGRPVDHVICGDVKSFGPGGRAHERTGQEDTTHFATGAAGGKTRLFSIMSVPSRVTAAGTPETAHVRCRESLYELP